MRKSIIIVALVAMLLPLAAMAQGKMAVGGKFGYFSKNKSMDVAALFQYRLTEGLRVAPDLGFSLRNDGLDAFFINANIHYAINLGSEGISLYPLAGLNYTSYGIHSSINLPSWDGDHMMEYKHSDHVNRLGLNLGAGFEYMIKPRLKGLAEWKYTITKDYSSMTFEAGIAYIF